MKTWRRTIAVISTFALLLNSLSAPLIVLAQTTTPEPTSAPTDSPNATIEPSSAPTVTPDATPTETAIPTPTETPLATDSASPTPSDQPVVTQSQDSNPTTQGPPSDTNQLVTSEPSASPSVTPSATPTVLEKEGILTTTVIENVDLSSVVELNCNVDLNLCTDKADYAPTDIVYVYGKDFTPDKTYLVVISSSDDPPVSSLDDEQDDHRTTDSQGTFSYAYQLDGNPRPNYKVEVKDGEFVVAQATFTDRPNDKIFWCHVEPNGNSQTLHLPLSALKKAGHMNASENPLHAGDHIGSCSTGTLKVNKVTVPSGNTNHFSISITGTGTVSGSDSYNGFATNHQKTFSVTQGVYSVAESSESGWAITGNTCQNITVLSGATVNCTITNSKTGSVTFEKIVDGGSASPTAWTFNISGDGTAKSGDSKTLNVGTYTITESGGPTGYSLSGASGVCSYNPTGGVITLNLTKDGGKCTITNKRDVSAFIAQKLNENNQPVVGWKFKLNDGAWIETDAQGQVLFDSLETGNYTVTEESRAGSYLSEVTSVTNSCQKIASNNNSATVNVPYSTRPVCVFKNIPIPKYEGVNSCPKDRPVKKLIDTHTINSTDTNGEVLSEVFNGNSYLFEASGTFSPTSAPGYVSDAAYTWLNGFLASQYGIGGAPPDYGAHALLADLGGGVGIVNWGAPNNSDHTYGFYYTPTLNSPQFVIGDRWSNWYGTTFDSQAGMFDNTGELTLNVYSCEQSPVKVVATKVVCDNEADLPNWGNHGASINASTAQNYVNSHPGCHIEPDWQFQYAPTGGYFGGFQTNVSTLGSPWTTFSGSVDVDPTILDGKIEVREVISDSTYVGFTNEAPETPDPRSAEIYCNGDVYNYDNWEWINNPQPGATYYCVAFNAKNYGSVTVTKYNDLDQDGEWDQGDGEDGEPTLNGWNIVLDQTTQPTVLGETTFSNLTSGNHSLNEILQGGYIQTNIQCFYDDDRAGQFQDDGYYVNVIPGENVQCYIGNFLEQPEVSISKTNNRGGGMSAGNTVDYTITLTNTGNINISDIVIQDILPGGFTYVPGSTWGELSGDPSISGSVLTWSGFQGLGTGGSITIHYQAVSSSDLADGLYTNFADCRASKGYENFRASNIESREVECDSANSTVKIGSGVSFGGSLGGQVLGISTVLGASTMLPATGSSTTLLVVALAALGLGIFLRMYNVKITKKKNKKHAKK